jgi:hypothetical protein
VRRFAAPLFSLLCVALIATTGVLYLAPRAFASDHQDSPLTVARPGADITDVYVFPANDPSKVVLAMDVWPLIPPGLGTQTYFDPGVLYQLKIGLQSDATEDLVLQFKADGVGASQHVTLYGPSRPISAGTSTAIMTAARSGEIPYNTTAALGAGIMAFAGPREDPFYFDLTQFYRLQPDRNFANQPNPPPNSARCFRKDGKDFLAGYSVLSLVVELPRQMLADGGHLGRINVWATTSLKSTDPTRRRNRRSRDSLMSRATSTRASAARPTPAERGRKWNASGGRRSKKPPSRSPTTMRRTAQRSPTTVCSQSRFAST